MSRLDSFIRRLSAQRDGLNYVADRVADVPGCVLELGLGNGRTFDHLRTLFPDRAMFVFERTVAAHPDCIPDSRYLRRGERTEILPGFVAEPPEPIALVHADLGSGRPEIDGPQAKWLGTLLSTHLVGAYVLSDQSLDGIPGLETVPLPETIPSGRYYFYRTAC